VINLLARYAECIFWLARYMERVENIARIIGVHETFSRDSGNGQGWVNIVRINADEERFRARHPVATAEAVLHFYILDESNPTSIAAGVRCARENARTLRPWISTEMWTQINVLHNRVRALGPEDILEPNLARLCAMIREECQTHTGITEGTYYRDEGWYHYQLGRALERADQSTRLLDIEFHALIAPADDPGAPADFVRWHALLRSASAYQAFRRVYPRGMTPAEVASFMLFNESFPRSVALCVRQMNDLMTVLKARYKLRGGNGALDRIDEIRVALVSHSIDHVLRHGLHRFLDWLQMRLSDVTAELSRDFFGASAMEQIEHQG